MGYGPKPDGGAHTIWGCPAAVERPPRSGHRTEGEIGGIVGPGDPGGPEAENYSFSRMLGGLGETMVSSESVAPVRFKWARYQPELTLPVPSRAHFRVFRQDSGLSEACKLRFAQPRSGGP